VDKKELNDDFVRSKTYFHGYFIEEDLTNNICRVFVLSKQDFGGYIPSWIIQYLAKSKPKQWYKLMERGISNYKILHLEDFIPESKL
jgi:hypothetical protein